MKNTETDVTFQRKKGDTTALFKESVNMHFREEETQAHMNDRLLCGGLDSSQHFWDYLPSCMVTM